MNQKPEYKNQGLINYRPKHGTGEHSQVRPPMTGMGSKNLMQNHMKAELVVLVFALHD